MNKLEQLKKHSVVVVDTGDILSVQQYAPQDATTNPSLILKASHKEEYRSLLDQARCLVQRFSHQDQKALVLDEVSVLFACEILKLIPGRVSTEVDARLSFDTAKTVEKARYLMTRFRAHGVESERVLIKIAATWEGIQSAKILEQEGIHCNLTLVFSFAQAVAAADAGAFLISPFVGRIYDWYVQKMGRDYQGGEDPGVQSVRKIYTYFKAHQIPTIVMGASFRNIGQIEALAGCNYLTISPALLSLLKNDTRPLKAGLVNLPILPCKRLFLDEASFRHQLKQDPMATEKLAEGIRLFSQDAEQLERLLGETGVLA